MKKGILGLAVWYFVAGSLGAGNVGNLSLTQIGPFATETACQNYNTRVSSFYFTFPCFSTTATK